MHMSEFVFTVRSPWGLIRPSVWLSWRMFHCPRIGGLAMNGSDLMLWPSHTNPYRRPAAPNLTPHPHARWMVPPTRPLAARRWWRRLLSLALSLKDGGGAISFPGRALSPQWPSPFPSPHSLGVSESHWNWFATLGSCQDWFITSVAWRCATHAFYSSPGQLYTPFA